MQLRRYQHNITVTYHQAQTSPLSALIIAGGGPTGASYTVVPAISAGLLVGSGLY